MFTFDFRHQAGWKPKFWKWPLLNRICVIQLGLFTPTYWLTGVEHSYVSCLLFSGPLASEWNHRTIKITILTKCIIHYLFVASCLNKDFWFHSEVLVICEIKKSFASCPAGIIYARILKCWWWHQREALIALVYWL